MKPSKKPSSSGSGVQMHLTPVEAAQFPMQAQMDASRKSARKAAQLHAPRQSKRPLARTGKLQSAG